MPHSGCEMGSNGQNADAFVRHLVLMQPLGSHSSAIRAHTLFGAVCWALAALGEDVAGLLEGFRDGAQFAFSCSHPFLRTQDLDPLLMLPCPRFRIPGETVANASSKHTLEQRVDLAKRVQKARYISPGVAGLWRAGIWGPVDLFSAALNGDVCLQQACLLLKDESHAVWGKAEAWFGWEDALVMHNSIDRLAGATVEGQLFQQRETFYRRNRAGLWFSVGSTPELWPKLRAALRFVADTGLGRKRSVGKGHFRFSYRDWDEALFGGESPLSSSRFLSLARYIPRRAQATEPVSYGVDIIRQKAESRYPQSSQRVFTASLRAFSVGSVFAVDEPRDALYGKLTPIGSVSDHTVYHSGLTMPLWGAWEV